MKDYPIFRTFLLFFLLCTVRSPMTYLPDDYSSNDPLFTDDTATSNSEVYKYVMFAYAIGPSSYTDRRTGQIYTAAASICYNGDDNTIVATQNTNVIATNPSLDLSSTYNKMLYDQNCESQSNLGLFFPINFHSDNSNIIYYLTFKLVNLGPSDLSFNLTLQNTLNVLLPLNTISQTLTANSIKDYTLMFKISAAGVVTYYLQEESFANPYTTTAGEIFFQNGLTTNPVLTSWTAATKIANMKVFIDNISDKIAVSAIILRAQLPVTNSFSTMTGKTSSANDCKDERQCLPNTSCLTTTRCKSCHKVCKSCTSTTFSDCSSCWASSVSFDQTLSPSSTCVADHVDFSKLSSSISLNVPPAINFRVTVNFWMWVHNTKTFDSTKAINIVYTDFLSVSIFQDTSNNLNLYIYCTPIDYIYPVTGEIISSNLITKLDTTLKAFYLKEKFASASSKWKFVQCAFSFDSAKTYLNQNAETNLPVPQQFNGLNNFPWFQKKFYDGGETVKFTIEGHSSLSTEIYFRNFNIFREYMPQNMSYLKYFNIHKLTLQGDFPQLLFSVPFDDLTPTGLLTNDYTWYDYSLRVSNFVVTNTEAASHTASVRIDPPRNFRRLNLLNPNKKFADIMLSATTNLTCPAASNFNYCFDESPSKPYACATDYYLNTSDWTCSQSCPNNFMRYPDDTVNNSNGYCINPCDSNSQTCPSAVNNYKTISAFSCSSGFINSYYKCYSDSSAYKNSALQFSSTLKTQPFSISLGTNYKSFVIDVWIYPDMRYNNPADGDYIFLTNNLVVIYGATTGKLTVGATSFDIEVGDTLINTTWNHLIIHANFASVTNVTEFHMSFKHIILRPNSNNGTLLPNIFQISGSTSLNTIYYCNKNSSLNTTLCTQNWINAFYKDLRIWDATYTNNRAVAYLYHYRDLDITKLYQLKHYFPMDMSNSVANKIQDKLNPSIYGSFPFNSATPNVNPDNTNVFNFSVNYAYEDIYPGNIITAFTVENTLVGNLTLDLCSSQCSKCYANGYSNCFECTASYGLWTNKCVQNDSTPQYYYRNPPTNPNNSLSLNITPLNLSSYPGLTVFFFLKLYGFTENSYTIITFNSATGFYLAYNPTTATNTQDEGALELYYNNVLQFRSTRYRDKKLGSWVPISISAYRQTNANLFPNMIHMAVGYQPLPILDTAMNSYVISEFTFPRTWIGLISDITFYKSFIINAFGFMKYKTDYSNNTKYIIGSFPMKSSTPGQCLGDYQMLSATAIGVGVKCVPDYNPHWNFTPTSCSSTMDNVWIDDDESTICSNYLYGCYCDTSSTSWCLNKNYLCACDHKDISNYNKKLYFYDNVKSIGPTNTSSYIVCSGSQGTDFARFNNGVLPGISNPTTTFNIDFWFYSQSYVNVNFASVTLTWDKHIKVSMTYNGANWIAYCLPIPDKNNPSNDSTPIIPINYGTTNLNNKWVYLNCGVDASIQKFYFIDSVTVPAGTSYTTVNTIPNSGTVTLTIAEGSPNGYGVTLLRQIRLWNCYSCSTAYRNIGYISNNVNFENVLHIWTGLNNNAYLNDLQGTANLYMTERSNFIGYNILTWIYDQVQCTESSGWFYSSSTGGCVYLLNFNRVGDLTYPSLPASRTSRYTIELWMWVEDVSQFTYGMNFIYDRHVGLSILRDQTTSTTLTSICFPQEYRDDLNSKSGPSVFTLYNSAYNKAMDFTNSASSAWVFFRCAVDLSRKQMFYLNQTAYKNITPEVLYSTNTNYRVYRFFDMPQYVNIYVQNMSLNNTRILLRSLTVYREFMDVSLYDLKWRDMKNFASNAFWPLVFTADFEEYSYSYLTNSYWGWYRYSDTDLGISGTAQLPNFTSAMTGPVYTTYPNYSRLNLCNSSQYGDGSNTCVNIGGTCNTTSIFCYKPSQYFYYVNNYINMSTLAAATSCSGSTRLPDSNSADGYCLFTCPGVNNISTCGSSTADIVTANYSTNFTCSPNYTRVYYDCVDSTLVPFSALYFNQFYSWSNLIIDFSPTFKDSYYFEFWFLMDNVNGPGTVSTNNLYLLAPPHYIFKDSNDQLFKYANYKISSGTRYYKLASISTYEWNKIIIQTQKNTSTNSYNIYIYVNYNFINPDVSITDLSTSLYDFSLQGIAFCNKPQATCVVNGTTYNPTWGTAWYRNIRVWDDSITSPYMIQSFQNSFSEYLKALYYFYPMTIDTISNNKVLEKINSVANSMSVVFWFFNLSYDNDIRLNYSINFDYGQLNPNTYITGVNSDSKSYLFSNCNLACKRCYTGSQNNCYECNAGYALYGNACYSVSSYFFKTPTNDLTVATVRIETVINSTFQFDISTKSPLTITFFVKYMGTQNSVTNATYYPIVYFYTTTTYLAFDSVNKIFVLFIGGAIAYKVPNAQGYIGVWTHVGLSIYRSTDTTLFTHMFNFMWHKNIITPEASFVPTTTPVNLDRIEFNTGTVAMYSSLKFYSNFYAGTFGQVTASIATQSNDFIFEVRLYGSTSSNCLADSELRTPQTAGSINLSCVGDYNPYLDFSIQCNNDSKYFDLALTQSSPPCSDCNSICTTRCFTSGSSGCTCTFNSNKHWIATQSPVSSYYCQPITSINFAFYNSITIPNISTVTNDEMTIEFWLYVSSFVSGKFGSINISWDKHNRVEIKSNGATLQANCYAFVDMSDFGKYTSSYQIIISERGWWYLRCAVNTYYKTFFMNSMTETNYSQAIPTFTMPSVTTLTISDDSPLNYGFSFIRELKLFSSYNFQFWNPSRTNLNPVNYPYMLHYFKNKFSGGDAVLIDGVKQNYNYLTLKSNLIGYNYVVDFKDLFTCDEGYYWDFANVSCKPFASNNCKIAADNSNSCLTCMDETIYLNKNGTCVSNCGPGFYQDTYLLQCRPCDPSCYTCNGKLPNQCTSCTGVFYYILGNSICANDCEKYGLTKSLTTNNMCGPFQAQAEITNYNISKAISPKLLSQLSVRVFNATANNYTVNWRFSDTDTDAINFDILPKLVLDPVGPLMGGATEFTVRLNSQFFKEKYKYVFWLDIRNYSPFGYTAIVSVKFVLQMNDFPKSGYLSSLPDKGYPNTTNFVLSCKNWTDDNTPTNNLQYYISYIQDYNNNTEKIIQNWSYSNEVICKFPLPSKATSYNYTVRCYCKDVMEAYSYSQTSVTIYANPSESLTTLSIGDLLLNNDFNTSLSDNELFVRSELLKSMAADYEKPYILNRTLINNTFMSSNLTLNDPVCTTDFCNNRGGCYVVDKFMTCSCTNFVGVNCQIDVTSYTGLKDAYDLVYKKLFESLTLDSSGVVLPGLGNLITGASYFVDDPSYLLQILDYIQLAQTVYPSTIFSNYQNYFEYYNDLIEWGINRISKYKIETEFKALGVLNNTLLRNSTMTDSQASQMNDYFNKIKTNFDDLLNFFSKNLKNGTASVIYRTRNFNVYITRVSTFFDYKNLFKTEIENYESYLDSSDCLNYVMRAKYDKTSYNLVMAYVNWKTTPFLPDSNLYFNNSSPMSGLKFFDDEINQYVPIEGCVNNTIKLFFPVTNQWLTDFINDKRELMDPLKQYPITSTMFNDPVYIDSQGKVLNFTVDERVNKYYMPFNFTCDFYNTENLTYDSTGCVYANFTEENYYQCDCAHLTDFVVNYFPNKKEFVINSRFFYLKHYLLLTYEGNYLSNMAFYCLAALLGLYISIVLFYSFCDCYIYKKLNILEYLKKQIVKLNMPYRKHYNFNLDMILPADDLNRIRLGAKNAQQKQELNKQKNEFELRDNDIRIHDVDVLILGQNLGEGPPEQFQRPKILDRDHMKLKAFFNLKEEKQGDKKNNFFTGELDGDIRPNKLLISNNNTNKNNAFDDSANEIKDGDLPNFDYNSNDVIHLKDLEKHTNTLDSNNQMNPIDDLDAANAITNINRQMNNFMNEDLDKEPEVVVRKRNTNLEDSSEEYLEDLPALSKNYELEIRLIEFAAIDLTFCEFFKRNLWNRHIVLVSLFRISIVYGNFKRIGIFTSTLSIMMICISLFLTMDETIIFANLFTDYLVLSKFIALCAISSVVSSILLYPLGWLFYINMTIFRSLYWVIVLDHGLRILKEWDKLNKHNFCRNLWGVVIHLVLYLAAFYISFCFCAVYLVQASTWFYALLGSLVLDFLLFETLWELIITIFYSCRRKSRSMLRTAEFLNRLRTMKTLT